MKDIKMHLCNYMYQLMVAGVLIPNYSLIDDAGSEGLRISIEYTIILLLNTCSMIRFADRGPNSSLIRFAVLGPSRLGQQI